MLTMVSIIQLWIVVLEFLSFFQLFHAPVPKQFWSENLDMTGTGCRAGGEIAISNGDSSTILQQS